MIIEIRKEGTDQVVGAVFFMEGQEPEVDIDPPHREAVAQALRPEPIQPDAKYTAAPHEPDLEPLTERWFRTVLRQRLFPEGYRYTFVRDPRDHR